jgi:hypothetical protein
MTPIGDETNAQIDKRVADAARQAAEQITASRRSTEGRREEDRHNRTQDIFGWACLALAGVIIIANVGVDVIEHRSPQFAASTVLLVVAMAAFGGALLQRVKVTGVLDRLPFKRKDADA